MAKADDSERQRAGSQSPRPRSVSGDPPHQDEGTPRGELVSDAMIVTIALAIGVALFGRLYRRYRAKALESVSDQRFIEMFLESYRTQEAPEQIAAERRRIERILGVPADKLVPDHTMAFLKDRFGYWADFYVAWSDLEDEAAESREAAGVARRSSPPSTIGELLEDRLLVPPHRR